MDENFERAGLLVLNGGWRTGAVLRSEDVAAIAGELRRAFHAGECLGQALERAAQAAQGMAAIREIETSVAKALEIALIHGTNVGLEKAAKHMDESTGGGVAGSYGDEIRAMKMEVPCG